MNLFWLIAAIVIGYLFVLKNMAKAKIKIDDHKKAIEKKSKNKKHSLNHQPDENIHQDGR